MLIGVSHRTAPLDVRERLAFTPAQARRAAEELRAERILGESVVLSTCNRSELYGVPADESTDGITSLENYLVGFHKLDASSLNGALYRHRDAEAVRHAFRVAAGLDSMLLGEAEILGQIRDAYQAALEARSTGPVLNRMFQAALEVGKRVRSETEIATRPMSVAFAGVKLAEQIFGKLKNRCALILGAGAVSEQVVEHLRNRGIARVMVANRSRERAMDLAAQFGGEVAPWTEIEEALRAPDMVVTSVSAEEPILTRALIERAMNARENRALFLIDLGVPRNVARDVGELYNVYLYNVDDLSGIVEENKRARAGEIPRAEAIVTEHVAKFEAWQAGVQINAVVEQLRAKLRDEGEAMLRERLNGADLPPDQRERLEKITGDVMNRFVMNRVERLRHERDAGQRLADLEALRRLFDLDGDG
ncbi:MAG TPA: glutamyl-tRNA reductase [Candidatus Acidoferrales bacterium]|nr:glutamyl-tRNA reductase [Candidatus Acidoferrales bacterium]